MSRFSWELPDIRDEAGKLSRGKTVRMICQSVEIPTITTKRWIEKVETGLKRLRKIYTHCHLNGVLLKNSYDALCKRSHSPR